MINGIVKNYTITYKSEDDCGVDEAAIENDALHQKKFEALKE